MHSRSNTIVSELQSSGRGELIAVFGGHLRREGFLTVRTPSSAAISFRSHNCAGSPFLCRCQTILSEKGGSPSGSSQERKSGWRQLARRARAAADDGRRGCDAHEN